MSCLLVDLAGIGGRSETVDCLMGEREVAMEADRVAREEIQRADVIVACHDVDADPAVAMAGRTNVEFIHVITRVDQQQAEK
ncbi:MAG TPA: hypothetical protein DEB70_11880 [Planctomycetaceae bacterium]|nr:hypothetical protein [Planctomycetaceae bacterium]